MADRFTDDDRGKDVVTSDGTTIGRINDVHDDDRATIERSNDEGLTDKVKDMLGWDDDDSNEIRNEHVGERDENRIRLREH